jgi:hypothetical protein
MFNIDYMPPNVEKLSFNVDNRYYNFTLSRSGQRRNFFNDLLKLKHLKTVEIDGVALSIDDFTKLLTVSGGLLSLVSDGKEAQKAVGLTNEQVIQAAAVEGSLERIARDGALAKKAIGLTNEEIIRVSFRLSGLSQIAKHGRKVQTVLGLKSEQIQEAAIEGNLFRLAEEAESQTKNLIVRLWSNIRGKIHRLFSSPMPGH